MTTDDRDYVFLRRSGVKGYLSKVPKEEEGGCCDDDFGQVRSCKHDAIGM
jgi:hypothetical protein